MQTSLMILVSYKKPPFLPWMNVPVDHERDDHIILVELVCQYEILEKKTFSSKIKKALRTKKTFCILKIKPYIKNQIRIQFHLEHLLQM